MNMVTASPIDGQPRSIAGFKRQPGERLTTNARRTSTKEETL